MTTVLRVDPWRDLSVIDARAPRFNQAIAALGASLAVFTGAWPVLALLGAQLAISVLFGRKYCLPCIVKFRFVQPRLGEGALEDSRLPKFANVIGAAFMLSASLAYATGFATVGVVLGSIVAVLALLAAVSGVCVGCEVYALIAKLRGVRGGGFERIDLQQLGVAEPGDVLVPGQEIRRLDGAAGLCGQ